MRRVGLTTAVLSVMATAAPGNGRADDAAFLAARTTMAERLLDPASARFTNLRMGRDLGEFRIVCGELQGRNALGAYGQRAPFVVMLRGIEVVDHAIRRDEDSPDRREPFSSSVQTVMRQHCPSLPVPQPGQALHDALMAAERQARLVGDRAMEPGTISGAPDPDQPPTSPTQRPVDNSAPLLNTLQALRQTAPQSPPRGRSLPPQSAPPASAGVPVTTAQLTAGERAGVADRISECWSVDAGGAGNQNIVVDLRIEADAGGVVRAVRPNDGVPSDPRARSAYEAARRALLDPRCNPLPLPPQRLAALRDTVFRFNPRDLGLR